MPLYTGNRPHMHRQGYVYCYPDPSSTQPDKQNILKRRLEQNFTWTNLHTGFLFMLCLEILYQF